jgi:hypothetical protein
MSCSLTKTCKKQNFLKKACTLYTCINQNLRTRAFILPKVISGGVKRKAEWQGKDEKVKSKEKESDEGYL